MRDTSEDENEEKKPERPLECSECRKPVAVRYTEVVGKSITHTSMCSDCPELERRLHGIPVKPEKAGVGDEATAGIACGNCGTTLDSVRMGGSLGCSECYVVFEGVLLQEMANSGKIPNRIAAAKRTIPIHIGRATGEVQMINPSLRLLALNEALSETLKREDYEQAAWLRDQIKALTDENPEKGDEGKK